MADVDLSTAVRQESSPWHFLILSTYCVWVCHAFEPMSIITRHNASFKRRRFMLAFV